jgi:pilus assembly protein TadC
MSPLVLLTAGVTAFAAGLVVVALVPPPKRLKTRIGPYLTPSLMALSPRRRGGPLRSVFGPIAQDLANWVGARIDRTGSAATLLRLRQAGWFKGLPEEQMEGAYRLMQLRSLGAGILVAAVLGQLLDGSAVMRLVLVGLGAVAGGSRTRGRLENAIEERRERMKIEIYTVNQLLAMRVRAGGGVIHAVKTTVQRGAGGVVGELSEALRLHRSGWRAPEAFRRIAELSPEPFCSRTYRLLASAEERGSDLAGALLSLSEDVRETRRESIKRTATKRRAAMLIPTVAILAPVLILFVAAPLPYLITGWQ